jgi:response regulator RpfG family c-di-GMP phosphodiesterase
LSFKTSTTNTAANNSNNNPIILLVDDEKDILTLFCEYLQAWGYQSISFDNPIDALKYIDNNDISNCSSLLIITDYKMPQMNGIDFIKKIREKQRSDFSLKIMLISAFMTSDFHFQNRLNNLKIDKIIEKPIRLEILKEEIKKLIN